MTFLSGLLFPSCGEMLEWQQVLYTEESCDFPVTESAGTIVTNLIIIQILYSDPFFKWNYWYNNVKYNIVNSAICKHFILIKSFYCCSFRRSQHFPKNITSRQLKLSHIKLHSLRIFFNFQINFWWCGFQLHLHLLAARWLSLFKDCPL